VQRLNISYLIICMLSIFCVDVMGMFTNPLAISEVGTGALLTGASCIPCYFMARTLFTKQKVEYLPGLPTPPKEKRFYCDGFYLPMTIVFLVLFGVGVGAMADGSLRLNT
jgi:hypothetical protein